MYRVAIPFGIVLLLVIGLLDYQRQEPSTLWWMVVEKVQDANQDVFIVRPDDRITRNITNNPRNDHGPDWSQQQQQFVFSSNRDRDAEIYRMQWDGSDLVQVTDYERNDLTPVWSPDGEWIAFISYRNEDWDIFRIRPDGSDEQNLTKSIGADQSPVWSPDGQWVAFVSGRDGNQEIYRMRSDGSDLQNLTNSPSRDDYPDWSPDGTGIVFSSDREGPDDILWMGPDGSNVRFITKTFNDQETNPHFSPDGQWILYNCLCDIYSTIRDQIFKMRVDGSDIQNLTSADFGVTDMRYGPAIDLAWHKEHLLGTGVLLMIVPFLIKKLFSL